MDNEQPTEAEIKQALMQVPRGVTRLRAALALAAQAVAGTNPPFVLLWQLDLSDYGNSYAESVWARCAQMLYSNQSNYTGDDWFLCAPGAFAIFQQLREFKQELPLVLEGAVYQGTLASYLPVYTLPDDSPLVQTNTVTHDFRCFCGNTKWVSVLDFNGHGINTRLTTPFREQKVQRGANERNRAGVDIFDGGRWR